MPATQTALILGASRGLGLALVEEFLKRGWRVVGTVRGTKRVKLHDLADKAKGMLEVENVDIAEPAQLKAFAERLKSRRFEQLFVNAGITFDKHATLEQTPDAEFVRTMLTNTLAPMRVIELLQHTVPEGGAIGVMSSRLGSIGSVGRTDGSGQPWDSYRASKVALNMLLANYASRHSDEKRAYIAIAPGWIRTDMGGPEATLGIEDAIPGVVSALIDNAGKPGMFYLNYKGETVPW